MSRQHTNTRHCCTEQGVLELGERMSEHRLQPVMTIVYKMGQSL